MKLSASLIIIIIIIIVAAIRDIADSRKLSQIVKRAREAVSDSETVEEMLARNLEDLGDLAALVERYLLNRGRRHARRRHRF